MSNGKEMIIYLIVGLIKKMLHKNEPYFHKPYKPFGGNINVKVDLSNYATKANLMNATGVYSLKYNVDKLDIDKLKTIPDDLSNLKSKVHKKDVDKLALVSGDLRKLSIVVKNNVVKKDVYNAKIKNIEDKIPDITNLATKTTLNAKINEVKGEIPSITNLATTAALTTVENIISNVSNLVKKLTNTQKLMKLKRKLLILIMISILLL